LVEVIVQYSNYPDFEGSLYSGSHDLLVVEGPDRGACIRVETSSYAPDTGPSFEITPWPDALKPCARMVLPASERPAPAMPPRPDS
jgi:hypothetical protein